MFGAASERSKEHLFSKAGNDEWKCLDKVWKWTNKKSVHPFSHNPGCWDACVDEQLVGWRRLAKEAESP